MIESVGRKMLIVYLLMLVPIAWVATHFDPYQLDGDAVSYMDLADLLHAHQWSAVVNGYWNPLYPACLMLGQMIFHPTRMNELSAYYSVDYVIFLGQIAAMLAFIRGLDRLRAMMNSAKREPLLSLNALRFLGVGLTVIASQRELSMGKIRPDALLEALVLAAFAMLLEALASDSLIFAPLMGVFLGMAYLTKSFAFLIALLSMAVLVLFQLLIQRRALPRVVASGALALLVFGAVSGPYIAALSRQKHRFDFGDSGGLAYAWFSSGTEKMHLEPWMTESFGSAKVELLHPEKQLMAHPAVYSYRAEPYGTYPPWFDTTFFNERIVPRLNMHLLARRAGRNLVLAGSYLLNHPEGWILLGLLLAYGARFGFTNWRLEGFWIPTVVLGLAMCLIYGLVLIEERYVTLAYFVVVLPVFAMLRVRVTENDGATEEGKWLRCCAGGLVALLAFLALGESLRIALERRRHNLADNLSAAWYSPKNYGAAKGLEAMGVKPGDQIACMGTTACVNDMYWARLAGVQIDTEIYNPETDHLLERFEGLSNRQQVYDVLKGQGAKVLVAYFDAGAMTGRTPGSMGWTRLGETNLYAMALNLKAAPDTKPAQLPWTTSP